MEEIVDGLRTRLVAEGGEDAPQGLTERLREAGTQRFVHGALFLRRCDGPIATPPLSVRATPAAAAADFVRLLAWRQRSRRPNFQEWLARSRPALAPKLELTTRQVVRNGRLEPADHVFSVESGFETALRPDAFVIPAVKRFDGRRSVEDVFRGAQGRRVPGRLPARGLCGSRPADGRAGPSDGRCFGLTRGKEAR